MSAELAAAHERGERLHAVTEELEVLDARNRTTEAARTRLQAENAELRRQLAASQASPPSAPAPPAPAQNTTATQTTAVWPDVDAALAREKAAGADQLAEMREAVKDLAARLKRSNAENSRAVEEQRALEAELQRFRSAGGSVDAALRRENAELLAQIEEMRAAQRKFLRGPSRTVPAAPPRSRRLPGQ